MTERARRLIAWAPALILMVAIATLSHQPGWPTVVVGYPDWVLHATAYAALAGAVWYGFHGRVRLPRGARTRWAAALVVTSLYGVFDEWHQSFIPGRHAAFGDWVADTVGAVVALLLLLALTIAGPRGVCED